MVIGIKGNRDFLTSLSNEYGQQIVHMARVGVADWTKMGFHSDIPNAELFFAPNTLKTFYKELGPAQAMQMINKASV